MTSNDSSKNKVVKVIDKKRKRETVDSLSKAISSLKKKMNKERELKAFQITFSSANIDGTSGALNSFGGQLGQGIGSTDRIGNQVFLVKAQYKIWCYVESSTTRGMGAFSMVLDRKPTGVLPAVTDVFLTTTPTSFQSYNNKTRFRVLRDNFFEYPTASGGDNYGQTFEGFIKINKTVQFSGTTASITSMTNGSNDLLGVWRSSNTSAGNTSYGTVTCIRYFYYDS